MRPFIEEGTSVTVTFFHPDDDPDYGKSIKTYFGKKISVPAYDHENPGYEVIWYNASSNKAWIFETDTANQKYIELYGKWIPSFNIGDTGPGEGIIFYKSETGFTVQGYGEVGDEGYFASYIAHYLEAAPANTATAVSWSSYDVNLIDGVTTFTATDDPKASWIGNGRKDTQLIVAHLATFPTETNRAAQLAVALQGGQNDWFLPSLGELYLLYQNRSVVDMPASNFFWSSSQTYADYAWNVLFINGNRHNLDKTSSYSVRAIRAF